MAQPDSEVRFAYEWNRKSFEQMNCALVEFDPQIEQWQRVLKAVVRAEIELHHNSFFWRLVPQSNGQDLTSELWQQRHRIDAEYPALSKRLWLWSQILQWRCPFRKPQPHAVPLCLWRDYQHTTSIFDTYGSTTTTGHEQLEARLFLRDWVQGKATPAEIAFLFPTG